MTMADMNPQEKVPVRFVWLDYAKAIGIFLVVFAHVADGIRRSPGGDVLTPYWIVYDFIYTFHMPLFFVISGYLFAWRPSTDVRKFVDSSLVGVFVPYVLWSVIFVLLQNLFPGASNQVVSISRLYNILLEPILHLWFLYVLFFVRVGYFLSYKLDRTYAFGVLLAAAVLSYAFVMQMDLPRQQWFMGFAMFGLGALLARSGLVETLRPGQWGLVLAGGAALWLACAASLSLVPGRPGVLYVLAAVFGVAMALGAARLLPAGQGLVARAFAFMGQASLAIYVAHTIFAAGLRSVLYKLGVIDPFFHVAAGTLVGIIGPAIVFLIANDLKLAPYIGFGHNQTRLYLSMRTRKAAPQLSAPR